MHPRRILPLVTLLLLAVPATSAPAATLSLSRRTLGQGAGAVTGCGTLTSVTVSYAVSASNVTGVTVSGIPAGCTGGILTLTLTNASGTDLGHAGPTTIGGTSVSFTSLSAQPAASSVTSIRLSVAGP